MLLITERTRKVLEGAIAEARQAGNAQVWPEHLVLALLGLGEGLAHRVLTQLGADPAALRSHIQAQLPRGSGKVPADIPFSPEAREIVVQHAMAEAKRLGNPYLGTEHLLLGLLRAGEGHLRAAGIEFEQAQRALVRLLESAESM